MQLDPQMKTLLDQLAGAEAKPFHAGSPQDARAAINALVGLVAGPPAKVAKVEAQLKVIDRGLALEKKKIAPLKAAVTAATLAHSDYLQAADAREMHRLLTQIMPISKRYAANRQRHQPDLALHWLNDEMFAGWVFGFKAFADEP